MTLKIRSDHGVAQLSEWPAVLFVCLFFFIFPLINLVALATSLAVIALVDYQSVTRASSQQYFNTALSAAQQEVTELNQSPFARFAHITPVGGYQNCGMNMFVDATNYWTNQAATYGPNQPLPAGIDLTKNICEYRSSVTYQMSPFINLASIPFIKDVPALGQPVTLHFETRHMVEHPEGLSMAAGGGTFSGGSTTLDLAANSGINTPGQLDDGSGSGWNYPNIYQLIANAGETVVAENVIIVQANNPNWTPTGLTVSPGCKVWIDSRANGQWTFLTTAPTFYSANGDPSNINATGFPTGALLGNVGSSTFMLGTSKLNYQLPSSGPMGVAMNDDAGPGANRPGYIGNRGEQVVRIIVAR